MTAALASAPTHALSTEQVEHFRREGYVILPRFMPADILAAVKAECDDEIAVRDAEMEKSGVFTQNLTHYKRRYFLAHSHKRRAALRRWIYSQQMAGVVRSLIGDTAFLFLEQFVVKGFDAGSKFGWHQDSGYVGFKHREYLTCWTAIDDVNIANGSISILPYSRRGGDPHSIPLHAKEEGTNDMIGYNGPDPGMPVEIPAGSMVLFSSHLFHRSGPNTTQGLRRAWLIQYIPEEMRKPTDGQIFIGADPFLKDGKIIADVS